MWPVVKQKNIKKYLCMLSNEEFSILIKMYQDIKIFMKMSSRAEIDGIR